MIEANELRIGNWVSWTNLLNNVKEVSQIGIEDFDLIVNKNMGHNYQPIPLTPELLEKCGFEITDDSGNWNYKEYTIYENKRFLIGEKENIFYCYRQVGDDYYSGMWPKLSSLHQLQNLFYCLCGEELEIDMH